LTEEEYIKAIKNNLDKTEGGRLLTDIMAFRRDLEKEPEKKEQLIRRFKQRHPDLSSYIIPIF
jgi:hypothetical protein